MVVAFERGEHVGVGPQLDEPVLGQVSRSAAGLPRLLDGPGGMPGVGRLQPGRPRFQLALLLGVGLVDALQIVQRGQQFVLRELQRVGPRDQREQPPLVHQVIHDQHLAVASGCGKLPTLQRVADRDVQCHPGGGGRAAADGDAAADQGAQHGEEAPALVLDRGGVGAVRCDVGVAVEQVLPRDAHVVEHDASVVHAGQAALVVAVRRRDARHVVAVVVADRHHEAVHAVALAAGDELREDRRHPRGLGGPADVVLARRRGGGVDDELCGVRVVGGGGLQRLNVAAVTGLGHRETAEQIQVHQPAHVGLVVAGGAEVGDRAAEQAPLHAGFDHQRQIGHGEHLDADHRRSHVTVAAVFLLEAVLRGACGGHDPKLLIHPGPGDGGGRGEVWGEHLPGQLGAHLVADVAPAPVERVAQVLGCGRHTHS